MAAAVQLSGYFVGSLGLCWQTHMCFVLPTVHMDQSSMFAWCLVVAGHSGSPPTPQAVLHLLMPQDCMSVSGLEPYALLLLAA